MAGEVNLAEFRSALQQWLWNWQKNWHLVLDLLDQSYLPIIAPLGQEEGSDCLNMNAGLAAALAQALSAEWLMFLSGAEGIRSPMAPASQN
ncbi:MAG TPA: hypothetical protein VHZ51_00910 [Ktedonobacteraceae bacterium]|nr:hypothetical protein [Ktedonobacteraceae bacterium]